MGMGWFGNDLKQSQYDKIDMEHQWSYGFMSGIFVGAIGMLIFVAILK